LPSIACLKLVAPDQWQHHFVLVIPEMVLEEEQPAVEQAKQHLSHAFQSAPDPTAIAGRLRALGYVSIEGFQVASAP